MSASEFLLTGAFAVAGVSSWQQGEAEQSQCASRQQSKPRQQEHAACVRACL